MRSRLLWRRTAASLGTYVAVGLGILATVVAAHLLGTLGFGLYSTALVAAAFFQTLLDLTVEESLTKYGFAYVTNEQWGRLRRLFGRALRLKLAGGLLATLALVALAPLSDSIFGPGLVTPLLVIAALPLAQAPENVATTALLLRERYDVRAAFLAVSMGLRLAGVAIGASYGVTEAMLGIVLAQVVATAAVGAAGFAAFRRFPAAPEESLAEDRRGIVSFVLQSSAATGMVSVRTALAPLLLGVVANTTQVGYFRIAQAPQTGFASLSSPFRLILLTEQTRDWERGLRADVFRGVVRYSLGAAAAMALLLPPLVWLMPDLIRAIFGREFLSATDAARIILFVAAIQLVFGWTKSIPVSIGRPNLRIVTHGIETAVLLPLVIVLGARWEATGAAIAMLIATAVFALVWTGLFVHLRREASAASADPGAQEALAG
jgi:O-antigen/teichoic acid export membrane protein